MKTTAYTVLYQDKYIVALNKASGISVSQDRWDPNVPRLDNLASEELGKLYTVHRIDKDTSGVIIYARDAETHAKLCEAFENREIHKTYHAFVYGRPQWDELVCESKLRPDGDNLHRTVIDKKHGKPSTTKFSVISSSTAGKKNCYNYSWICAEPITGRTHQIRVQLAQEGFPIVCDALYGTSAPFYLSKIKKNWKGDAFLERPLLSRLGLHAYKIEFIHPVTQANIEIIAPYWKDMSSLKNQFDRLF